MEEDLQNWELFYRMTREPQNLFIYGLRGYQFSKGYLQGRYVKDVYNESEQVLDYLYDLYHHEDSNWHTKFVIKRIYKELGIKKIF